MKKLNYVPPRSKEFEASLDRLIEVVRDVALALNDFLLWSEKEKQRGKKELDRPSIMN